MSILVFHQDVLKRPFPSVTGEALTLPVTCSGLLGDRAFSQNRSFSGKMVLKRLYISDTWKPLHVHCLGHLGDGAC